LVFLRDFSPRLAIFLFLFYDNLRPECSIPRAYNARSHTFFIELNNKAHTQTKLYINKYIFIYIFDNCKVCLALPPIGIKLFACVRAFMCMCLSMYSCACLDTYKIRPNGCNNANVRFYFACLNFPIKTKLLQRGITYVGVLLQWYNLHDPRPE
jgi:hypothetical protein